MRLIPRHSRHHHRRPKAPRISISQAEITADLHYPVSARSHQHDLAIARRGFAR